MPHPEYDRNVFFNCPLDPDYVPLFEALVFAINELGFRAKSAREHLDSSQLRLQKIVGLIGASRYSIHDLSRTTLDKATSLPRFNMPLELGIDLGCKSFSPEHADKSLLIFDSEQYRFRTFVSDLSGQDIHDHANDPRVAITRVRNWLRAESGSSEMPGGAAIYGRYQDFRSKLPGICVDLRLDLGELTFADFTYAIAHWVARNR